MELGGSDLEFRGSANRSQHSRLRAAHGAALHGCAVVVAGQMQEAVDEVEGEFGGGRAAELAGDVDGALGTNDEFAEAGGEVEGEHVGRAGVVEEALVQLGDGGVVHEGDAEGVDL